MKKRKPGRPSDTLNMRQEKYVHEYINNGFNSVQAAISAGYKNKNINVTATKIHNNKAVQAMIKKYQALVEKVTTLTFEKKLRKLEKVIDDFLPDEVTSDTKKATVAISAISEANKMQGHYAPDKHVSVNANLNADADIVKLNQIAEEVIKSKEKPF